MTTHLGWLAILLYPARGYETEVDVTATIGLYVMAFIALVFRKSINKGASSLIYSEDESDDVRRRREMANVFIGIGCLIMAVVGTFLVLGEFR